MNILIPIDAYLKSMAFSKNEDATIILTHSLNGLSRNDLINDWTTGGQEDLEKEFKEIKSGGIVIQPSSFGTELFLWACGYPEVHPAKFLTTNIKLEDCLNINNIINEVSRVTPHTIFQFGT